MSDVCGGVNTLRGHPIALTGGRWIFTDTGEPTVSTWRSRPCGHCGLPTTPTGHDACLGEIDGAINACCGHGEESEAYVQFSALAAVRGRAALVWVSQQTPPPPVSSLAGGDPMPDETDLALMTDVLAAEIDELVARVFYADELAERVSSRPDLAHVDRDDLTAVIEAALEEMGKEAARRMGEGDA